jgi:hypothetical protein
MEDEKKQIYKSDYLEGRRHNAVLYGRLIDKLSDRIGAELAKYPEAEIRISMSAKYQTPLLVVEKVEDKDFKLKIEDAIYFVLEDVGFEHINTDFKDDGRIVIDFED